MYYRYWPTVYNTLSLHVHLPYFCLLCQSWLIIIKKNGMHIIYGWAGLPAPGRLLHNIINRKTIVHISEVTILSTQHTLHLWFYIGEDTFLKKMVTFIPEYFVSRLRKVDESDVTIGTVLWYKLRMECKKPLGLSRYSIILSPIGTKTIHFVTARVHFGPCRG